MAKIPAQASDFSVGWMNEILASHLGTNRVTDCSARASDIPGQTAEVVLIDVAYETATDLPSKMVAKITSADPDILRLLIANYDQYRRETSFYREFPDVGISVPQCLHQEHNPDTQEFVILMGDLAPSYSPSWAIKPDEVEHALMALPAFHGKWWNDPVLREKDWLVQYDNRPFFTVAFQAAAGAAEKINSHYSDADLSIELMARSGEKLDELLNFVASRPFTFVHGDYHSKQMFFPSDEGGDFAVIDWQFPFVAQGAWDFARLAGMCLETSERRQRESDLLARYHSGLEASGVKNYSLTDLESDYRIGLLVSQMIMSIAHGDTDVELFKAECGGLGVDWQDAMLLRTQRALDDWDVLDFVQSL